MINTFLNQTQKTKKSPKDSSKCNMRLMKRQTREKKLVKMKKEMHKRGIEPPIFA
jgi:hypothetical protein